MSFFSVTEKLQLRRPLRAQHWELQMGAVTVPDGISSCSLMDSTSDKNQQPALSIWPEDLIQLEPTSSAVNIQKLCVHV